MPDDRFLRFIDAKAPEATLASAIAAAAESAPATKEARASIDESLGAEQEVRGGLRPRIDIDVSGQQVISRRSSNDPNNVLWSHAPKRLRAEAAVAQARATLAASRAAQGRAAAAVTETRGEDRAIRERFLSAATEARAQVRAEEAGAQATMPALRDRVDRLALRAPVDGTVNRVLVNTIGGVVRAGEPLVEIVPLDDTLVVETRISPRDIGFLYPSQPVKIRITAYDSAIYGSLLGWVESVGSDAVVDEARNESYYIVKVRTRKTLRDVTGRPLSIVPGMVAEVDILGNPRSVLSYLLTPFDRLRDSALRER